MGARKYQTIGGSFQDYITAYDAKRLRDYYGNGDSAEFNFAAAGKFWKTPNGGQLLRFNRVAGESTLTARENEEHNTLKLYVSGNTLLDCRTDAAPLFGAGWFNNGAADVPGNQCFNNVLAIRKKSEPWKRIVMKRWRISNIAAESEDQIKEAIVVNQNDLSTWVGLELELMLELNQTNKSLETRIDDNVGTYPIEIFADSTCT